MSLVNFTPHKSKKSNPSSYNISCVIFWVLREGWTVNLIKPDKSKQKGVMFQTDGKNIDI